MSLKYAKKPYKKIKKVLKNTTSSKDKAAPGPVSIPVFQLPHNIKTIPEEAEIHQGFFVNMDVVPHDERRYSGMMSLADVEQLQAIERYATTAVEFRSFSCPLQTRTQ